MGCLLTSEITYRSSRASDAATALPIVYAAFRAINDRHGFPPDFESEAQAVTDMAPLFELPFVEGITAERDQQVVGSAFLWRLGETIGIGPVTISPHVQGKGIGAGMMRTLLNRCDGARSIRLVQAGFNMGSLSLYSKLGFALREPLVCMQGEPIRTTIPGYGVRSAQESDIPHACDLAQRVLGFDRSTELGGAIHQGSAVVVERDGQMVGYAAGLGFFSHAVASDNVALIAMIAHASEFTGPGFLLPTRNTEVLRWCLECGLRIVQPLNLMTMGEYHEPQGSVLPSILF